MNNSSSVLCVGGMHFDCIAQSYTPLQMKASNPVRNSYVAGGVAHNIACDLAALGTQSSMLSLVGDDTDGHAILADTKKRGVDLSLVSQQKGITSASYTAVLDPMGELALGLSNTDTYDLITPEFLAPRLNQIHQYKTLIVDANLPQSSITWLGQNKGPARLYSAPVSPSKSMRWLQAIPNVDVFICNEREASQLTSLPCQSIPEALIAARALRSKGAVIAVVTLGPQGAVISSTDLEAHFTIAKTNVVDVNGAGDAFFAGFTHALHSKLSLSEAMQSGIASASLMAEAPGPVWDNVSIFDLKKRLKTVPPHKNLS